MKIEEFLDMMMTPTPEDEQPKPKISTLIFMDLETTGLPQDVGKRNVHITELSLIAVDRQDFETDSSFRVLNKLSLCVRPRTRVSYGAMYITGLYNDKLENQKEFNDSVPKVLELFFQRLRPPICLLAHNGKLFDFPVLQAELNRLKCSLSSDILCADTLEAFRKIHKNSTTSAKDIPEQQDSACNKKMEIEDINLQVNNTSIDANITSRAEDENISLKNTACFREKPSSEHVASVSDDEVEKLLTEDIACFQELKEPIYDCENNEETNTGISKAFKTCVPSEFVSPMQNEQTPPKSRTDPELTLKEGVGRNKKRKRIQDPTYNPQKRYTFKPQSSLARRSLFPISDTSKGIPSTHSSSLLINKIAHFSLPKLYEHFFGEAPPQSHYAEADCVALSKVCQRISEEFLKWIDDNSTVFCETKPMW